MLNSDNLFEAPDSDKGVFNIIKKIVGWLKQEFVNGYCKIFFVIILIVIFALSFNVNRKMNMEQRIKNNLKEKNDSLIENLFDVKAKEEIYLYNIYKCLVDSSNDTLMQGINISLSNIYMRLSEMENAKDCNTIK